MWTRLRFVQAMSTPRFCTVLTLRSCIDTANWWIVALSRHEEGLTTHVSAIRAERFVHPQHHIPLLEARWSTMALALFSFWKCLFAWRWREGSTIRWCMSWICCPIFPSWYRRDVYIYNMSWFQHSFQENSCETWIVRLCVDMCSFQSFEHC